MSRLYKKTAAALIIFALIFAMAGTTVFAATTNYAYNGSGSDMTLSPVTIYGEDDLFGAVTKDMMPGDSRTVTIQLENNTNRRAHFYMRAEPVLVGEPTEPSPPPSAVLYAMRSMEADVYADKRSADELLDYFDIKIYFEKDGVETTIYEGPLRGERKSAGKDIYMPYDEVTTANQDKVHLGTLDRNSSGYIYATLTVDEALPNELQDTMTAVKWIFYVTQPSAPPPVVVPTPTPSEEVIPPESPPLEEPPEEPEIEIIPPAETPVTEPDVVLVVDGDTGQIPLTGGIQTYIVPLLVVVAVLSLALVLVKRLRKA